MLTVACVLRSGGDYTPLYVARLQRAVRRNLTVEHEFVCLSDLPQEALAGIRVIPLLHGWPGWWSKLELFRLPGPLLYFDLDTVILGSLDDVPAAIEALGGSIVMLRQFPGGSRPRWISGLMAWAGDLRAIHECFVEFVKHAVYEEPSYTDPSGQKFRGDEAWIGPAFQQMSIPIVGAQSLWSGIHSYKREIRRGRVSLEDARIVCFHGHPRPVEVEHISWVKEHWQ